jgi:hypothetical protein
MDTGRLAVHIPRRTVARSEREHLPRPLGPEFAEGSLLQWT